MPSQNREAVELYNLGLNLSKQNRFEEAIEPLTDAIKMDSNYVNAYNLLGKVYIHIGDVEQAKVYWTEALRLEPFNTTATLCLEALETKPLIERVREVIPIASAIALVMGFVFIFLSIRQINLRLKSIEAMLMEARAPTPRPPEVQAPPSTHNAQAREVAEVQQNPSEPQRVETPQAHAMMIDVEPEFEVIAEFEVTENQQPVEEETKPSPPPAPKTSTAPPPQETVEPQPTSETRPIRIDPAKIPTTIAELDAQYKKAIGLYNDQKYAAALTEFRGVTQSSLVRRQIGSAHLYAGRCYLKLGEPANALAEFEKVTADNAYEKTFREAREEIQSVNE